jgi:hypothetical protein
VSHEYDDGSPEAERAAESAGLRRPRQINIFGEEEPPDPKASFDQYLTHPWVVDAHLRHLMGSAQFNGVKLRPGDPDWAPRFIDLGAGRGAYIDGILRLYPRAKITAVELDPDMVEILRDTYHAERTSGQISILHKDLRELPSMARHDYCVSNPPYQNGLAEAAVMAGLHHARFVSLLLRLPFLCGGKDRIPFWRKVKPITAGIFAPRPPFLSEEGNGAMSDFACIEFRRRENPRSTRTSVEVDWLLWKDRT